jgi:hypothetical protein
MVRRNGLSNQQWFSVAYFTMLLVTQILWLRKFGRGKIINWKECGMWKLWPYSRYKSLYCLERPRKTTSTLSEECRRPCRDSNPEIFRKVLQHWSTLSRKIDRRQMKYKCVWMREDERRFLSSLMELLIVHKTWLWAIRSGRKVTPDVSKKPFAELN